jgi:hypothetical protein
MVIGDLSPPFSTALVRAFYWASCSINAGCGRPQTTKALTSQRTPKYPF